jgi:hypothetical protein
MNWKDQTFRNFMSELLTKLEPWFEKKHTILVDEVAELNEITFVSKGSIVIGYEINKQKKYCIKFKNNCVVGAFECTFNRRSSFIYTCLTECKGFFIRKNQWHSLIEDHEEVTNKLKSNILIYNLS